MVSQLTSLISALDLSVYFTSTHNQTCAKEVNKYIAYLLQKVWLIKSTTPG